MEVVVTEHIVLQTRRARAAGAPGPSPAEEDRHHGQTAGGPHVPALRAGPRGLHQRGRPTRAVSQPAPSSG